MELPLLDLPARRAFAERAGPILDLYEGRWPGELLEPGRPGRLRRREALDPGASADPPHQPTPAGLRVEHEYERKGALCYLAAWDVQRARIFDRRAPEDGIEPSIS